VPILELYDWSDQLMLVVAAISGSEAELKLGTSAGAVLAKEAGTLPMFTCRVKDCVYSTRRGTQ